MNRIFKTGVAFLATAMMASSCSQWIDPSINIDPNNPSDINPRNGLTAIEAAASYTIGGDLYRYASLFTQQHLGFDRQHLGIYQYTFTESDVSTMWQNFYSGHMKELDVMIGKSTALNAPHFRGVARVMMSLSLSSLTDAMGDVPFSQAFQGGANFTPTYDKQEQLYPRIQSMLDSAIQDLAATSSSISPGAEDLIFAGNRQRWTRAAWTLKARLALHLSKRNRMQAAQQALQFIANGMQSSADDMQLVFGATDDQSNPLYQFDQQRNDIRMHPNFIQTLTRLNDPRRALLVRTRNNDMTQLGAYYASPNSPVVLISFAEAKFIEAEANLILGNAAAAKTAYTAGVRGALTSIGIAAAGIDSYVAQESVTPAGELTLERLIEQKYIGLYPSSESWTDWRRTGFPTLQAITGNNIPRRFPYPQTERDFNNANWTAAGASSLAAFIYNRVWWDVQ